ncbi:hypothetical protein VAE308_1010489 [Vibrio aestuarianus]|nr:hypothetical protein VAE308_1010489 [Vibrio aestuarianus]
MTQISSEKLITHSGVKLNKIIIKPLKSKNKTTMSHMIKKVSFEQQKI